ncbi:MAG: hypothetical protein JST85_09665 [Acidobacteria bacterium]|nr:hypothetical protein [Acidobacteriota bacterium]
MKQSPVVLGVFHNTDELFRACAVLTDFGYPKELARLSRAETFLPAGKNTRLRSVLRHVTVTKILLMLLAIAATTIGTVVVANMSLGSYGPFAEILITLLVWASFFSAGSLACVLIGFLIWTLAESLLAQKADKERKQFLANSFYGRVALRIKARDREDADEIAQAWAEIGGRVIEPSKPSLALPKSN